MQEHWKEFGPPVYIAVASYLGLVKPKAKRRKVKSKGAFLDLLKDFTGAGGNVQ